MPFCKLPFFGILITLGVILIVTSDPCFDVFSAVQDGVFMRHHAYRRVSAYSISVCAAECLMSPVCLSFSYQKHKHLCYFNDNNTAVTDIVPSQDFIYSDISAWPRSLAGQCSVTSCVGSLRCHVDRLHRASCVPEFRGCGEPPDVSGLHKEYDGHYLSAVATYTCDTDYLNCQEETTSVCQSTGQWEAVTAQCEQFRWDNAVTGTDYYIPCGYGEQFTATIVGTPTQPLRVMVRIMKGEDYVHNIGFLFDFETHTNATVFNTKVDGTFQPITELPTNPLTVNQEFTMKLRLRNGMYSVFVDNVLLNSLPETWPALKPDHIRFDKEVTLNRVEFSF